LNPKEEIRRIVVALDASPHSRAAMEAAAQLAAQLHAELLGMFVEDINLLRSAELPCAREVAFATRAPRAMDSRRLERALRAQAAELQQMLAAMAQRRKIRWTFRVARGRVASELLAAAQEGDMLVLGRVGTSVVQRARLGSTAQTMVSTARHTVVFLEPVLVLFDGSENALRALATAARLARADSLRLVVLIAGTDADTYQRLLEQASNWLTERDQRARIRPVAPGIVNLAQAVREEGGRTLVLATDHVFVEQKTLCDLMDQVRCPVVLVR
jgi:nucleotide-binding universal stress UspA family protein